jgi:hypothetical protein
MLGECVEAISKPKAQQSTDVWKTEVENAKYCTYRKCGYFAGRKMCEGCKTLFESVLYRLGGKVMRCDAN